MHKLLIRFAHEIEFTDSIQNNSSTGSMTIVRFIITETSEITNTVVESEGFRGMNIPKQIFGIIESTIWVPAKCNGKNVSSIVRIPIRICLQ